MSDLINTPFLPPGFQYIQESARMAKAYHSLEPYPKFGFKSWKTEARGPLPKCSPLVRQIVKKGAFWLFGKPVSFTVDQGKDKDSSQVTDWINEAWSANNMPAKSLAMAETGAQSGMMVLKGSWDEDAVKSGRAKHPFRINVLDGVEHCRLYYDPQDNERLLMARVQYPYRDDSDGKWYLYREEWTDELEVHYDPLPVPNASALEQAVDFAAKNDTEQKWVESGRKKNIFKVIPLVQVKNIEAGYWHGVGDLWRLFAAIDSLNLTYDLAIKDNQISVFPKKVYIDVQQADDTQPLDGGPGAEEYLASTSEHKQGEVKYLEASGAIREHIAGFAQEWKNQILECAGSVEIRPEEITNKGNMTSQVMKLVHQPLIEMTDCKRQCYGEAVCKFFETMLLGFSNAGLYTEGKGADVSILWPAYFDPSEEELSTKTTRLASAVQSGFTTQKRAAESLALDEGCTDVPELLKELPEPATAENTAEETNGNGNKGKAEPDTNP